MNESFTSRHIGPNAEETEQMLKKIGTPSLDALIGETIPSSIRLEDPLNLPEALSEYEYCKHIKEIASKNKIFRTYIGLGYYNCITPGVIQRNIMENPGWYTSYTPYQAEISQGRLEALLVFQTMLMDLTAMEIANASLLDEATAAAEAMTMLYNTRSKEAVKREINKFFVSNECFPQTIEVLKTRSEPLGIEIIFGNHEEMDINDKIFGVLLQYPTSDGAVYDYSGFVRKAHDNEISVVVAADILGLTLLTPPGEWGADVVVGSTQRFGIPMGYGGPHAAYFATKEQFKRNIPGRIIGVSIDAEGNRALRMALQTREQHIRRDKATSNICTSQVLLAVMAGMYAVYHGPHGLKSIAKRINHLTALLNEEVVKLGYKQVNGIFFDTLKIQIPEDVSIDEIQRSALNAEINFRYINDKTIGISIDETTDINDINDILNIFAMAHSNSNNKYPTSSIQSAKLSTQTPTSNIKQQISNIQHPASIIQYLTSLPDNLKRDTSFLTHPIFNTYHSETGMMRYIKKLENKDLSLTHSMIPLGSCTMKLTAAQELFYLSWQEFGAVHPFVPVEQAKGYTLIISELEKLLCEITGFDAISFQPNSGAQGEFAGLMVIREYHKNRGEGHRNIALIPASAHGTNPASAVMAGMEAIMVKCDDAGNIEVDDLKEKAIKYRDNLSAFMVTYPSTHGVFEENIIEINQIIHNNGGQVYMDGANLNAQIGLTNPAIIGADVCHLNLHKTFGIPHGGGGPGMGPIGVAVHLTPFLPSHPLLRTQSSQLTTHNSFIHRSFSEGGQLTPVSAAPYGSPFVLPISYGYIKMLGGKGLKKVSKAAICNANYISVSLQKHYSILYKGKNGYVGHEMILDCREFKRTAQIEVEDIAKRLIDYGYHAPTVSFPVIGTMMIEPTESESKQELDRFCESLISIRDEIREIEESRADLRDNVLKNAPHTASVAASDKWEHSYSRQKAVYPLEWTRENKYWSPVSRIDNAFGDRNLVCCCPAFENYAEEVV
ncbi:MAG: aminomethyl-transferring glycine dehydrogenase [Bacteroidota bacterium]